MANIFSLLLLVSYFFGVNITSHLVGELALPSKASAPCTTDVSLRQRLARPLMRHVQIISLMECKMNSVSTFLESLVHATFDFTT